MLKLIIEDDEKQVKVVRLLRDEVTIGRKEGNTIRLTERNVSRRHARLIQRPEGILLEDLGSYNGVKVNGERITEPLPVSEGDKIVIGDYSLMLKLEEQEGAADPFEEMATVPVERMDMEAVQADSGAVPAVASVPVPAAAPAQPAIQASAPAIPAVADMPLSAVESTELIPAAEVAQLVLLSTNLSGTHYSLDRSPMVIGRTPENDIVIDHKGISRNHAKITFSHGIYSVADLQSQNGVRINGELYESMSLRKGDTLDLGNVRLRFLAPGEKFDAAAEAYSVSGGKGNKAIIFIALAMVAVVGIGFVVFGDKLFGGKKKEAPVQTKGQEISVDQVMKKLEDFKSNRQWAEALAYIDTTLARQTFPGSDREKLQNEKSILQQAVEHKKLFDSIQRQLTAKQWVDAYRGMKSIPEGSLLYGESRKEVELIRKHFQQNAMDSAKQSVLAKKCAEIEGLIRTGTELEIQDLTELQQHHKACSTASLPIAMEPMTPPVEPMTPPVEPMTPPVEPMTPPMTPEKPGSMTPEKPMTPDKKPPEMASDKPSPQEADAMLAQAWELRQSDCNRAVRLAQRSYSVKQNPRALQIVGLCGCNSKNATWARWAYSRISGPQKNAIQSLCNKNGINLD